MINDLKKLYPNHLIIIRKSNKLYDENDIIIDDNVLKKQSYVIIDGMSYEIHKKISRKKKKSL